jgi:hypothetical protein
MSTTSIKGENGIIFIAIDNAWKPIACLTSTSLESTINVIERETKCAPGVVEKRPGSFNYNLSMDGEYIDTTSVGGDDTKQSHDALLLLQINKTQITWKLDTDVTETDSAKYYGTAILSSLSLTQGAGSELSTFSATFEGNGAISLDDPLTPPSV